DRRPLYVHVVYGGGTYRDHVAQCAVCQTRMATLTIHLARLDAVLRTTAPRRRIRQTAPRWRWMPVAAAAMLALAVAVHRHGGAPGTAPSEDDTLALADELASIVFEEAEAAAPPSAVATAPSTCPWGDPL